MCGCVVVGVLCVGVLWMCSCRFVNELYVGVLWLWCCACVACSTSSGGVYVPCIYTQAS